MRIVKTAAIALCIACSGTAPAAERPETAPLGSWGVNLSDQDRSIRPGDDFAMYENGAWFKRTILSAQQANAAYWRDVRDRRRQAHQPDARRPRRGATPERLVARRRRWSPPSIARRWIMTPSTGPAWCRWQPELGAIRSASHPRPIRKADGIDRGTGHASPADCSGRARPRLLFAAPSTSTGGDPAVRALCRPGRPDPSRTRILYRSRVRRPPVRAIASMSPTRCD